MARQQLGSRRTAPDGRLPSGAQLLLYLRRQAQMMMAVALPIAVIKRARAAANPPTSVTLMSTFAPPRP